MIERGLFIVFDGSEGGGKTLQIKLLNKYLKEKSIPSICVHEPGSTELGLKIRKIVKDRGEDEHIDPRAELLLFYAARSQLIAEKIKPSLDRGVTVLADRFEAASYAYQGIARGLGTKFIEDLSRNIVQSANCVPDLYMILDLDPKIGLVRKMEQGVTEMQYFEKQEMDFHLAVREGYREFAKRARGGNFGLAKWSEAIDATKEREIVTQEVRTIVDQLLQL